MLLPYQLALEEYKKDKNIIKFVSRSYKLALSWRGDKENKLANALLHYLPLEQLDTKSVSELLSETFNGGADTSDYTQRLELLLQELKKQLKGQDSSLSDIDLAYAMFMVTDLVN